MRTRLWPLLCNLMDCLGQIINVVRGNTSHGDTTIFGHVDVKFTCKPVNLKKRTIKLGKLSNESSKPVRVKGLRSKTCQSGR